MPEDRALELLERATRLDPELIHEHLSRVLVHAQRVGLATRAVEGEHELSASALPEWLLGHERLELADEIRVSTQREASLDRFLAGDEVQLLEPGDLGLRERRVGEVGECRPAPESERARERLGGIGRVAAGEDSSAVGEQPLEALRVQPISVDLERVSRRARHERRGIAGRREALTSSRHVDVEQMVRTGWGPLGPELVDEPVGRHHGTRFQDQDGQQGPRLDAAEIERPPPVTDLERAQNPEVDHRLPGLGSGRPRG